MIGALPLVPSVARAGTSDTPPPLSPAQTALFETPHLSNIAHPETLDYRFEQTGPAAFADQVSVHIYQIHPDGPKYFRFEYISPAHHHFIHSDTDYYSIPLSLLF